jgi:hypothetical protein
MKRKEKKSKKEDKGVTVKTGQKQETKINIKIGEVAKKKKNVKRRSAPVRPAVSYVSVPPVVFQQAVPPQQMPRDYLQKPISRTITEIMDPAPVRNANDIEQEKEKERIKSKVEKNAEEQRERLRRMKEVNERRLSAEEKRKAEEVIRKASEGFEEPPKSIFTQTGSRVFNEPNTQNSLSASLPSMEGAARAMPQIEESETTTPTPKKRGRKPKYALKSTPTEDDTKQRKMPEFLE